MKKIPDTVEQTISALKKADISSHDVARIMRAALKKIERFEPEDVALCTTSLLDKLRALPLQDTIVIEPDTGRMFVRGRLVKSADVQKKIIADAKAMRRNLARKLVREKVEFEATAIGMRRATNLWDIVFGQAALWFAQQEDELYIRIVGRVPESDGENSD